MTPDQVSAIANSVSSGCAVIALIGLGLYTDYTRRMTKASDAALRANIEPLLVPEIVTRDFKEFLDSAHFTVVLSNEGNGPALQCSSIQFDDAKSLEHYGRFFEFPDSLGRAAFKTMRSKTNLDGEDALKFNVPKLGKSTMVIISYKDSMNTWHQCHIQYQQSSQMEWMTNIAYCRKRSKYPTSLYKYPKRLLRD